jgi:hypothetical protein
LTQLRDPHDHDHDPHGQSLDHGQFHDRDLGENLAGRLHHSSAGRHRDDGMGDNPVTVLGS